MQFSLQVHWNRKRRDDYKCETDKLVEAFSRY